MGIDHRGFWSGFLYVTLVMGQLLALVLLLLMQYVLLTPQQIASWGWRVPFLIGALGAVLVFWLRRQMTESDSFKNAHTEEEKGGIRVLLHHWRAVLTVCGLTLGGTVAFYTYTIYMQKYLANTLGFPKETATLISTASLVVFAAMQPVFGALSDKIGRKPLLLFFGFAATFGTIPLLHVLAGASSPWTAFALIVTALFIASGYTSINAIVKAELFPTRIRALGVALPYALTVSIFGGTTEYIALWCKQIDHHIIKASKISIGLAGQRIFRQFCNAVAFFTKAQFTQGAQHTAAGFTTNLASLDGNIQPRHIGTRFGKNNS